jgi:3-hydroxyanthranilate 3,4-dioxygenase
VFFVGGPNSRLDYHLEEGDEIFFQIKGHMVLKVIEHGIHKDIRICEGELFLLPAYVEHSPQRFEDSLGCVVERDRNDNEFDCVRLFLKYFTP